MVGKAVLDTASMITPNRVVGSAAGAQLCRIAFTRTPGNVVVKSIAGSVGYGVGYFGGYMGSAGAGIAYTTVQAGLEPVPETQSNKTVLDKVVEVSKSATDGKISENAEKIRNINPKPGKSLSIIIIFPAFFMENGANNPHLKEHFCSTENQFFTEFASVVNHIGKITVSCIVLYFAYISFTYLMSICTRKHEMNKSTYNKIISTLNLLIICVR